MLSLLSLLQTRRDWPGRILAERLEVTPRTVRRDVERLRELGYEIRSVKGPDGGYRLAAGSELPPLLFDDEQAVAIAVALQSVPAMGVDVDEAAERALATVRQVMPSRLRHRIDGIRFTGAEPEPGPGAEPRVDPVVLEAASAAVRDRLTLRFDRVGEEAGPPRRVEPHAIVARRSRWYLVAWDLDREDWRTFRVDRITPRTPTGPRFAPREVPGGDVRAWVGARFRGATSEGARVTDTWPCWGEVVLEAPLRRVLPFAADGTAHEVAPGRTRLRAGSWSWIALATELGRFDAEIEVLGPPELADAFVVLAERFARSATTGVRRSGGT